MVKITFKKDRREFHNSVTQAVKEYFEKVGKDKKANTFMYFKTLFFTTTLICSYIALLLGGFGLWIGYLLWVCLGLSSVFLAVNCGHDAIHGAYSKKKWVNTLMSKSYDLLGANSYLWSITHNIVHHTYTSIEGEDEDIESVPFSRLTPFQDWRPFQKFQHIYVFFLYTFATLSWVLVKDYKKFFKKKIANYDNKHHPRIEYFNLFFFKLIYYILFFVLPILIIDLPWYLIMGGFVISHLVEGFTIAIIFALAHIVEEAQFQLPDEEGIMQNNWAVHQMQTTADFGRKNAITSFLTGGLNFQIEHHLFPSICHVHYPVISEIVKQKALEHGVPYNDIPSFWMALKSHYRLLKKLGNHTYVSPLMIRSAKADSIDVV